MTQGITSVFVSALRALRERLANLRRPTGVGNPVGATYLSALPGLRRRHPQIAMSRLKCGSWRHNRYLLPALMACGGADRCKAVTATDAARFAACLPVAPRAPGAQSPVPGSRIVEAHMCNGVFQPLLDL